MDIQKLLDGMSAMGRLTRRNYHLTLGALTMKLEALPTEMPVEFDDGSPVGEEQSYRGYYDDLAFARGPKSSLVTDVLEACRRAASQTYTGYKGGDFTYDADTPLWSAEYGCTGPAIIDAIERDDKLILVTRQVQP